MNAIIHNQDCIAGMREHVADDSVHLTVTSIPFEELFTYSGKVEDVGNNGSTVDIRTGRFALNMRFVIAELLRVTAPGCNVCVHIQQLLAYKNQHGFMGRRDFRGAIVDLFRGGGQVSEPGPEAHRLMLSTYEAAFSAAMAKLEAESLTDADRTLARAIADDAATRITEQAERIGQNAVANGGFNFIGEFVIPKDPQAMAQRLSLHSLQFKTGYARHACNLAPAVNDYVLIFQKPGEFVAPVRSLIHTERNPNAWVTTNEWVKWASGVWDDIDEFDIIDGARSARESDEEKHVCPLQLEVIRRLVRLYTNPIDIQPDVTVLDPFMGVGSTSAMCIELDRNCIGFELKESYYRNALLNVARAKAKRTRADAPPEIGLFEIDDLDKTLVPRGAPAVGAA